MIVIDDSSWFKKLDEWFAQAKKVRKGKAQKEDLKAHRDALKKHKEIT